MRSDVSQKAKTYVCGDIHGNFRALQEVLEKVNFDPSIDTLITIGDYIDGGKHIEVLEVMEFLNQLPNWIGIIGNHDYWMLETIEAGWEYIVDNAWLDYGGHNTLRSLGVTLEKEDDQFKLLNKLPEVALEFCNKLKYYHVDEQNNLYVHAGYDYENGSIRSAKEIDLEFIYATIWDREFWKTANDIKGIPYDHVFIGHTWSVEHPKLRGKVWNLDSGAGFHNRLTVMDVATKKYLKSSRTPRLYKNFQNR